MTKPQYALQYDTCTLKECRRFIHQRTGVEQEPRSSRIAIMRNLRKLDEANTFQRFLDLPKEIRNIIYGYLILPDRTANARFEAVINGTSPGQVIKHRWLEVLRASKQLNVEAEDVLYLTNPCRLRVTGELYASSPREVTHTSTSLGDFHTSKGGESIIHFRMRADTPEESILPWPAVIHKVRHLTIRIQIKAQKIPETISCSACLAETQTGPDKMVGLNHALYWLVYRLRRSGNLRTLRIELEQPLKSDVITEEQVERILFPITLLQPLPNGLKCVRLFGFSNDFLETPERNAAVARPDGGVMDAAYRLMAEAHEVKQESRYNPSQGGSAALAKELATRARALRTLLEREAWIDEENEREILLAYEKLEEWLDKR